MASTDGEAGERLPCYRCGRPVGPDERRPIVLTKLRPRPHLEKAPLCPDCNQTLLGHFAEAKDWRDRLRLLMPIFTVSISLLIWRWDSWTPWIIAEVLLVFGIPMFVLAWRAKRVLKPEFPYSTDYRLMTRRARRLSEPLPWWKGALYAVVGTLVLVVVLAAIAAFFS